MFVCDILLFLTLLDQSVFRI